MSSKRQTHTITNNQRALSAENQQAFATHLQEKVKQPSRCSQQVEEWPSFYLPPSALFLVTFPRVIHSMSISLLLRKSKTCFKRCWAAIHSLSRQELFLLIQAVLNNCLFVICFLRLLALSVLGSFRDVHSLAGCQLKTLFLEAAAAFPKFHLVSVSRERLTKRCERPWYNFRRPSYMAKSF